MRLRLGIAGSEGLPAARIGERRIFLNPWKSVGLPVVTTSRLTETYREREVLFYLVSSSRRANLLSNS